jgi:hypothetical protein
MKLPFKISFLISALLLCFMVANFAWAQATGSGFFLEKGKEFFIFDNLYINGSLAVGSDVMNKETKPGDVLVSKELTLDDQQSFIFCKDEKNINKQSINRDCANKVMVWYADLNRGLDVIDTSLSKVQTDKIEVTSQVIFNGTASINTSVPIIIDGGCLANSTNKDCTSNQLKTAKVLVKNNLGLVSEKVTDGANTITFDAGTIQLHDVNLGVADDRHFICATGLTCGDPTFTNCPIFKPYAGYIKSYWNPNIMGTNNNKILKCDLDVRFTNPNP